MTITQRERETAPAEPELIAALRAWGESEGAGAAPGGARSAIDPAELERLLAAPVGAGPELIPLGADLPMAKRPGARRPFPVGAPLELEPNASVQTTGSGRALARFADGSAMLLDAETSIVLGRSGPLAERARLRSGRVYAWVSPQRNGERFALVTPSGEVTVLGTEFELSVGGAAAGEGANGASSMADALRLLVARGEVAFQRAAEPSDDRALVRSVHAGQELTCAADGAVAIRAVPAEELRRRLAWTDAAPPAARARAIRRRRVVAAAALLLLALAAAWQWRGSFRPEPAPAGAPALALAGDLRLLPDRREPFLYRPLAEAGRWSILARHYVNAPGGSSEVRTHGFELHAELLPGESAQDGPASYRLRTKVAAAKSLVVAADGTSSEVAASLETAMRGLEFSSVSSGGGTFSRFEGLEGASETPILAYLEFSSRDFDWSPGREVVPGEAWEIRQEFPFEGQPGAACSFQATVRFDGYVRLGDQVAALASVERSWRVENFNFGSPGDPHCLIARMDGSDRGWVALDPGTGFPLEQRIETSIVVNDGGDAYVNVPLRDAAQAVFSYPANDGAPLGAK